MYPRLRFEPAWYLEELQEKTLFSATAFGDHNVWLSVRYKKNNLIFAEKEQ